MPQLVMRWTNDGTPRKPIELPAGVEVKCLSDFEDYITPWCSVARYLQPEGYPDYTDEALFEAALGSRKNFRPDTTVLLLLEGQPVSTFTILCDPETRKGYMHMVAARPECRGRGLGHLMNNLAVDILKREGMESCWLTTDDWRLAAIKTYLKAGFCPDLEAEPDAKERWEKILDQLK